ncbi:MAG: TetR/AcrR family transcriptional regulator [Desulfobacteraceae bacterium]|nr:MAG: TetR/AcrR family transcriptional regulator [Desulfobacteraceae bacterium]
MPPMKRPLKKTQPVVNKNKKLHSEDDGCGKKTTRENIINAASIVFSNFPYYAASIRMIGKEAKIDHPLINYYFPTKAALFEEVLRTTIEVYYQANIQWFEGLSALGPEKGFSLYVDRLIDFALNHPKPMRIIALNLVQARQSDIIPGYQLLQQFFLDAMQTFIRSVPVKGADFDIQRLTTNFNTMAINYLGASDYYAGILGMESQSPEYLKWVKDSLTCIILPWLKQLLEDGETDNRGAG